MIKSSIIGYFCLWTTVYAACPELYPNNTPVNVPNTVELCNNFYVSLFDKDANAVRYVSERLVMTAGFSNIKRVNAFRQDSRVPSSVTPRAYAGSRYDKGHLAPADDASTVDEMYQTFYMTNVTPQSPELNRGSWKSLEFKVRSMVSDVPMWVETIPVYPKTPTHVANVPVPSGYWKITNTHTTRFFYAKNTKSGTVKEFPKVNKKLLLK